MAKMVSYFSKRNTKPCKSELLHFSFSFFSPTGLLQRKDAQRLWIDLCAARRDVAGLKAAQTNFTEGALQDQIQ